MQVRFRRPGDGWLLAATALAASVFSSAMAHAEGEPTPSPATAAKVKLPDGPGSVRGLGDEAEVGAFTADVKYGIPFQVPAGWNGLAPQLGLSYEGNLGNGPVGVGWTLGLMQIRRSLHNGVPSFTDADELEIVGLGGGGRLVNKKVDAYGKVEYRIEGSGNAYRVIFDGIRFIVTDSDGTNYIFGSEHESRQEDGEGRVVAWLPDRVENLAGPNLHGDHIHFNYLRHENQLYLSEMTWGPPVGSQDHHFRVVLEYEERFDPTVSFREGFRVTTAYRLKSVSVRSFDADDRDWELRAYHLTYEESLSLSRLIDVRMTGFDGADEQSPELPNGDLPNVTLTYAGPEPASAVAGEGLDGWALEQRGVAFFDIDGDGMEDLYRVEMGNHEYRRNYGDHFGPPTPLTGASALDLSTVTFMDLDGDSRSELVRIVNDTWRYSKLVDGHWTEGTLWPGTAGVPLSGPNVAVADVNADGRMDVVQGTTDGIRYWRNTASGLAPAVYLPPIDPSDVLVTPGQANVHLLDFNGDGLADVVWLGDTWMEVFLGRGDGTFEPWRRVFYPWVPSAINIADLKLADLDRDGLVDLVRFTADNVLWFQGLAAGRFSWYPRHVPRPENVDYDAKMALADANGNGSTDIVWSSPEGMWILDLAGGTSAGMLHSIDNGIGKLTTFQYRASAQISVDAELAASPWTRKLPVSVPVPITSMIDVGDGSPLRIIHHGVRDGFWDGVERRFGGFLEATKALAGEDAADVSLETTRFLEGVGSDRVLRGKPSYVRLEDGLGVVNKETWTKWAAHPVEGCDDPLCRVAVTSQVLTRNHEAVDPAIDTLTFYEYDTQARVVVEENRGRLDMEGDESRIEKDYAEDDLDLWIRDRACRERLFDGLGTQVSRTATYYGPLTGDTGSLVLCDDIGLGLVRMTQGWFSDESRYVNLTTTEYTPRWNPEHVYAEGVHRTYGYDASDFRVTSEAVDGITLEWSLGWDDVRGLATTMTDPSGVVTTATYDPLDRPRRVAVGAAGPVPNPYVRYVYDWSGARPTTTTLQFDGTQAALVAWNGTSEVNWRRTVAVTDGAGRSLFTATQLDSSTWVVAGFRERDQRGRTAKMHDSFYWVAGTDPRQAAPTEATPEPPPAQTFAYDAFDRLVEQTLPTGATKSFAYQAFRTAQTVTDLAPVEMSYDGQNRIIHTERTVGTTTETVDAIYDAAGRILERRLQGGAVVSTFEYDTLGRLKWSLDPDIGERTLSWWDTGRLHTEMNDEDQAVTYAYDPAGRLLSVDADDGSSFSYIYDVPKQEDPDAGDYHYTNGRLAYVEELQDSSQTGLVKLGYDKYGHQDVYKRTIDGLSAREAPTYSPSGLMLHQELDSEVSFDVIYDQAARPVQIMKGAEPLWLVSQFDEDPIYGLDAAGRIKFEEYGNGVTEGYQYNDNGAATHITVERPYVTQPLIYDVAVTRNGWDGVTLVEDEDLVGSDQGAVFGYDQGARLTSATIGTSEAQPFSFEYTYDGLQNMRSRNQLSGASLGMFEGVYSYPVSGPRRQLTSIGDPQVASFEYDSAGRETWQHDVAHNKHFHLEYNGLDQLTRVYGVGDEPVKHAYGYDGVRVKTMAVDGSVTRWYTPSILEHDGVREHYVMLGDRIIARITNGRIDQEADGGVGGLLAPDVERGIRLGLLAAGLLFITALALRTNRHARWMEVTAAAAIVVVVQAGCGIFSRKERLEWTTPEVLYFHGGISAGPVLITRNDDCGSIYAERRYEPFGEGIDELSEAPGECGPRTKVEGVDYSRERFNLLNKPADIDTGWSYHGARWMTPETARWLTPDPPVKGPSAESMESPWELHPYQYVDQNPISFWDPEGEGKAPKATDSPPDLTLDDALEATPDQVAHEKEFERDLSGDFVYHYQGEPEVKTFFMSRGGKEKDWSWGRACLTAARMMNWDSNKLTHQVAGYTAIQVAVAEDYTTGNVDVDSRAAQAGRDYIDTNLDNHLVTTIGVSYMPEPGGMRTGDFMTDHFPVIFYRGIEYNKTLNKHFVYYAYGDPGIPNDPIGRLYVDKHTQNLFRVPLRPSSNPIISHNYQMTQVRVLTKPRRPRK